MLRRPPHILVTTPESLFILLTAEKSRQVLRTTSTVIIDEIHAMADDKRGSHLALSLARLDALTERRAQRIGLSATVKPIGEVACLLGSDARIVDVGHWREIDLGVEVPRDMLGAVASTEIWNEVYDRIAELIQEHRTTIVFVNTRRLSERIAHALGERLGPNVVLPHHGSLSMPYAVRGGSEAEARRTEGGRGNSVTRIGDRYWNGGSDVPNWFASVYCGGAAADWAVGPLGGRDAEGPAIRGYARRADRVRGGGFRDSQRRVGADQNP